MYKSSESFFGVEREQGNMYVLLCIGIIIVIPTAEFKELSCFLKSAGL